ncbi:MAG: cadherin-like domain-containing protein, partial [Pseudomonadales bacterium]|nr:cadherin-like domain-containing protein [Pseudomonadales bacterium]
DDFTVSSSDGTTHVISITVNGANDAAVFGGVDTGAVTEDAGPDQQASGTLTHTDVDGDDANNTFTVFSGTGTYGSLAMDAAGAWTYTLDDTDPDTDALDDGDIVNDDFTVSSSDGTTHVISITVNGANDAPVGTADSETTDEDTALTTVVVLDDDTDVDGDALSVTVFDNPSAQGATVINNGDDTFTYDPTGSAALQALDSGDSVGDTFTYTVSDGTATDVVTVTVTVNGVNDPAVFGGADTGAVTENLGDDTAGGTLTHTDVDGDDADNTFNIFSGTGTYGGLTMDAAGIWTYTLNDADPDTDALDDTDVVNDDFTVSSSDGTTHVISITVNGANDAAVFGGVDTGAVTEDAGPDQQASGTLTHTDVDGDDANNTFTVFSGTGTYGSLAMDAAGAWTYTLDDTDPDTDALDDGDIVNDDFTVSSSDGTTHVISITVNGANDAAVFGGVDTGAVTEDAGPDQQASGTLTHTDVDGDDANNTFTVFSGTGTYGSLAMDAAGAWTYTLDDTDPDTDALDDGDIVNDDFTVSSSDG